MSCSRFLWYSKSFPHSETGNTDKHLRCLQSVPLSFYPFHPSSCSLRFRYLPNNSCHLHFYFSVPDNKSVHLSAVGHVQVQASLRISRLLRSGKHILLLHRFHSSGPRLHKYISYPQITGKNHCFPFCFSLSCRNIPHSFCLFWCCIS